jgi:predicted nuclease of predicted toxin-antitoxin system
MTIKILVDINLSPDWVPALARERWEAVHWSAVGDPRARRTTSS